MPIRSRLEFNWQNQAQHPPPGSITLGALPLPAALLNPEGTIAETNPEWDALYPGFSGGISSAAWCRNLHESSPPLFVTLFEGLQNVLSGARRRFAQDSDASGCARRVRIAEAAGGVLIVVEQVAGQASPPVPETAQRSPRLETIGRTVSGVAHDFANLLTLIAGYGDMLLNRTTEGDPGREEILEIRRAAERGSQLTSQLLGFTRGATIQPQLLDLNSLVTDVQRMLRPILGELIEIRLDLEPGLDQVLADPGQLEQILMNLLLNARDAMPTGGRIRIETSGFMLEPADATSLEMEAGRCVLVAVTDTGKGIDPETTERIFQPFFTTKERGEGTGLGLSIVLRIVKECGGAIRVRNSPGEGARFVVYLPGSRHSAQLGNSTAASHAVPGGSETLLVVEDDEAVRRLVVRVLKNQGYAVLEAGDGEEALQVLEANVSAVHLVLTDMVMPRMGGRELAGQLRTLHPGLPILFVSGYTDDVLHRTGDLDPGMLFLRKPLHPHALAAKVREALDSSSRPFNPR